MPASWWSSRGGTRPARAASSSGSRSTCRPASAGSWPCRPRPSASGRSGTSSATWPQLPAGGEITLFDRSWYNRAGVEHVMGFCTSEEYHRFLRQCPVFEHQLIEDGDHPGQVLVLGQRRGAGAAVPVTGRRSPAALEAERDRPRGAPALVGLLACEGRHVPAHRHARVALVRGRRRGQAARPASTASPTCCRASPTARSTRRASSCRSG